MKKYLQVRVFALFLVVATAVFLTACNNSDTLPPPAATNVPATVTTPELTPTTAVCTPLPDDMTVDVVFESDRHGIIHITGLQPDEKPTILLMGDSTKTTDSWRKESQHYHVVHEYQESEPTEIVGFPAPVTDMRQHYVFDNASGLLLQESREARLTTEEWVSAGETTYTQFDSVTAKLTYKLS